MKKINFPIDFVVLWVDGSDIEWKKEFNKHLPDNLKYKTLDINENRYRDNGLLKYWFRGVEKYAPWVNKIHFVTNGQKPDWLNINHPKINWVKHSDYIDSKYLPLFNSSAIEISIHKIPNLSEHFVYFNDDFFLTNTVSPYYYYNKNGKPKDMAFLYTIGHDLFGHLLMNNESLIESILNKKNCIKKNWKKWFSLKYGKKLVSTLYFWKRVNHAYIRLHHFSQPYCKETFQSLWNIADKELSTTLNNRYRDITDYTHNVYREFSLFNGDFVPTNHYKGRKFFDITDNTGIIVKTINNKHIHEIVLNDHECDDYEQRIKLISETFEKKLPNKSCFEL